MTKLSLLKKISKLSSRGVKRRGDLDVLIEEKDCHALRARNDRDKK